MNSRNPALTAARRNATRATRRVFKTMHYMRMVISPERDRFQWEFWGEVLVDHVIAAVHAARYSEDVERASRA